MKRNIAIFIIVIVTAVLAGILCFILSERKAYVLTPRVPEVQEQKMSTQKEELQKIISEPIANAKTRITKKPFGIYIAPATSSVQPEKFMGYHTGTDFEITLDELNASVSIYAICSGKVRQKEIVNGYGGVIIQDCTIDEQAATVLYGHINIRQVQALGIGSEVNSGDMIGYLAEAVSDLSGGERKHLHLGIYKGQDVDYRGYVESQNELIGWIDIENYL